MKRSLILSMMILAAGCARGPRISVPPDSMRAHFDAISAHKFGETREPLSLVEDLVRTSHGDAAARAELRRLFDAVISSGAASPEGKQFACRQLAVIGTAENVPALRDLLANPEAADSARIALESIPDPAAGRALIKGLGKAGGRQKLGIVNSLGARRDAKAIDALSEILEADLPIEALAAARSLGKIGGAEAAEELDEARAKAAPEVRRGVDVALIQCADEAGKAGNSDLALAIFEKLTKSVNGAAPNIQIAAGEGIIAVLGEGAVTQVLDLIESDDAAARARGLRHARRMPGGGVTRALAARAGSLPHEQQALLIEALGDRGDPAAVPALIAAARSDEEKVRSAALNALGKVGDGSAIPILAKEAARAPRGSNSSAAEGLDRLKGPDVDATLIALAQPGDGKFGAEERARVIGAIGRRRTPGASGVLLAAAGESDKTVRLAALGSLGSVGSPADVPAVTDLLLQEKDAEVAEAAALALGGIAARAEDREAVGAPLAAAIGRANSPESKANVLRALGAIGGDAAVKALTREATNANPAIREAAIRQLAASNDPRLAESLIEIAKGLKKDDPARSLALRGSAQASASNAENSPEQKVARLAEAMNLAVDGEDRKAILTTLAGVRCPAALALCEAWFGPKETRDAAIASAAKIALGISGANAEQAKASMLTALGLIGTDPARAAQPLRVLEMIKRFEDYITAWEVSGPYGKRGKSGSELFDEAFAPETDGVETKWSPMPAGTDAEKPWLLDLAAAIGGSNKAAYLRTNVWSVAAQKVRMELGSDDGVKVWLNGAVVHGNNVSRGVRPGADNVEVELVRGWNTLMLKVVNGGADWGACLRLRAPDGGKIDGVRASIDTGGTTPPAETAPAKPLYRKSSSTSNGSGAGAARSSVTAALQSVWPGP